MGLQKYWEKRDFNITPEPRGKVVKTGEELSYYIQEHHARRLHYDFRLELDGTLKSWAVPKGPSLDPSEKRLAVHVEDHPLEYGTFEGDIPEHQYGAGHVKLWDRGTWTPLGNPSKDYRRGRLKFRLDGVKLSGVWNLVRMPMREEGKDNWLLIKEDDEEARSGDEAHITTLRPESVSDNPPGTRKIWQSNRAVDASPETAKTKASKSAKPSKTTTASTSASLAKVAGAKKMAMPDMISPQLATLAPHAPEGDDWLSEIKFDGYRAVTRIGNGKVSMFTRAANDWTDKWEQIAGVIGKLPVKQAWLDGEVVALDAEGNISFQALQNMARSGKKARLAYYVFDLVYLDGYDLSETPLIERKRLLKEIFDGATQSDVIRYSDHIVGGAQQVFEHACMHGMEGIVVKRADTGYLQSRGRAWLKVKCLQRQEFVIGGYTDPAGSREEFGALLVGVYDDKQQLQYAGRVGTGFDAALLKSVSKDFKHLEQTKAPFHNPPKGYEAKGVHWLKPELVAEINFAQWTDSGSIRHASFAGLRKDKPPQEIRREEPLSERELKKAEKEAAKADVVKPDVAKDETRSAPSSSGGKKGTATVAGVNITHPSKILFPGIGLTKLELAQYYERVADWILPHLKDRPLTLVRCPDGGEKECFFQKNAKETTPAEVGRIVVPVDGTSTYMEAESVKALIGLIQMGVLELHTWGSHEGSLELPDRMIFDIDPAEGLDWDRVVEAALLIRSLLEEIGLRSFLKTTGGKGLHVVTPLKPERDWDEIKAFSKSIAEHLSRTLPDRFTANMSKSKRTDRIFIDYLRNGLGATAVAAYSTRAKPNAPVSVPVAWEELESDLRSNSYTVRNIFERLDNLKQDPWKDYFKLQQRITDDMLRLFD
ncbi:MAG TPA: DNA ligase D [Methylophilaceae bacterium]|nr:DNA ligase D [Methylophilaceae bacterium]